MAVYLDDQDLGAFTGSLAELLDAARSRLSDGRRVVVEVQLDGQTLDQAALDDQLEKPTGAAEVRLYSADPVELCLQALGDTRHQLAELGKLQQSAAELLQSDEGAEAYAKLGVVIQVWLNVSQAVTQSSDLAGVDLATLDVGGEPASAVTEGLVEQLRSVKGLVEAQDTTGLADALAYEWPPVIEKWDALVQAVSGSIESQV